MDFFKSPTEMTPEEILEEVVEILIGGYFRLRQGEPSLRAELCASQETDFTQKSLDSPANLIPHVH